ncbi:quinon protein alcohol dehydrogenase-like superfamily [Entophlyctis helioformis]|nr:quinon protein alcohol dehydrogenase-like superfamily [Entophlyctis helioformis]
MPRSIEEAHALSPPATPMTASTSSRAQTPAAPAASSSAPAGTAGRPPLPRPSGSPWAIPSTAASPLPSASGTLSTSAATALGAPGEPGAPGVSSPLSSSPTEFAGLPPPAFPPLVPSTPSPSTARLPAPQSATSSPSTTAAQPSTASKWRQPKPLRSPQHAAHEPPHSKPSLVARIALPAPQQINPERCFIGRLPDEILIHVLSNLEHDELQHATAVCKRWKAVVSDEQCWRSAFANYFGTLPLRRIAARSWRSEYVQRIALARDWLKSKQGVQFDPRIGRLEEMFVDPIDGRLLIGSVQKGMISICHPSTGRVEKDTIFCSDDAVALAVGALKIDRLRIAVGYLTGQVALITNFRDKAMHTLIKFSGAHAGPVTCLAWLAGDLGILVSGSDDGFVRIWDVSAARCALILKGDGTSIVHVAVDQHDHVIAATESGCVLVWDLDVMALVPQSIQSLAQVQGADSVALNHAILGEPVKPTRTLRCAAAPVAFLLYDPASFTAVAATKPLADSTASSNTSSASSDMHESSSLSLWHVGTGRRLVRFTVGHVCSISALAWDRPTKGPSPTGHSYIVSGDTSGSIKMWKVPPARPIDDDDIVTVSPMRVLAALHLAPISRVIMDDHKVVSGSDDGKVKITDVLAGYTIRNLSLKLSRSSPWAELENDDTRGAIRCLWAGERALIACAGGSVKYWSFDHSRGPANQGTGHSAKKKKGRGWTPAGGGVQAGAAAGAGAGNRASRGPDRSSAYDEDIYDIADDIRDIRREIDAERGEIAFLRHQHESFNGSGLTRSNMTEEELLSYAIMLSTEQMNADEARRLESDFGTEHARAMSLFDQQQGQRRNVAGQSARRRSQHAERPDASEWDDDELDREDMSRLDPDLVQYLSPRMVGRQGHVDDAADLLGDAQSISDDMLSTSGDGRRKVVFGTSAGPRSAPGHGHAAGFSGAGAEYVSRSANSAAADLIQRWSPRMAPISPSMHPAYRGGHHQPTGNVVVAQRPSQWDEDDELQYVLELSLLDK